MSAPDLTPAPRELIFLYDVMSPFSYLASKRIGALCQRHGVTVRWQPVFLAGIIKATGNETAVTLGVQSKIRWGMRDFQQQAEALGIPVEFPALFPQSSLNALRALLQIEDASARQRASVELFALMFEQGGSLEDLAGVAAALNRAGANAEDLLARSVTEEGKAILRKATDAAVAAGAFGVPTFLVRGADGNPQLFWGNDRLAFAVQRAAGLPLAML